MKVKFKISILKKMGLKKKTIEDLKKKMDIDSIFTLYNEIKSGNNLVSLKNFSVDFIVQTKQNFKTFESGVRDFERSFKMRKLFKVFDDKYIKLLNIHGFRVATVNEKTNHNSLNAFFFQEKKLNNWMFSHLEEKLNNGVPVEILDGLIIAIDKGDLKVIFSDKFIKE